MAVSQLSYEAIKLQASTDQCHKMTQGEGGSKIGQKSVTYYLNGPLYDAPRVKSLYNEQTLLTSGSWSGINAATKGINGP